MQLFPFSYFFNKFRNIFVIPQVHFKWKRLKCGWLAFTKIWFIFQRFILQYTSEHWNTIPAQMFTKRKYGKYTARQIQTKCSNFLIVDSRKGLFVLFLYQSVSLYLPAAPLYSRRVASSGKSNSGHHDGAAGWQITISITSNPSFPSWSTGARCPNPHYIDFQVSWRIWLVGHGHCLRVSISISIAGSV